MFEQMRRSLPGWEWNEGRETWGGSDLALDVHRDEDGYLLVADVPGFERDEIELTADGGVLVIDASHEVTGDEYARSRHVHERTPIPDGVNVEEITASYRNGVLEVRMPAEDGGDDGRRIDIEN